MATVDKREDFVEVNVQPLGIDSAFSIELRVQDSTLNPHPFLINLGFQLEEGELPGLNDDATNDPQEVITLAKGLLLCDETDLPELGEVPAAECSPGQRGYFYNLEIEMELEGEQGPEVHFQDWQVSLFHSEILNTIDRHTLFCMVQDFFRTHM